MGCCEEDRYDKLSRPFPINWIGTNLNKPAEYRIFYQQVGNQLPSAEPPLQEESTLKFEVIMECG